MKRPPRRSFLMQKNKIGVELQPKKTRRNRLQLTQPLVAESLQTKIARIRQFFHLDFFGHDRKCRRGAKHMKGFYASTKEYT